MIRETLNMTDAYIIESGGETAGIVVVEDRGLRFYASTSHYYPLDGQTFENVSAAHRAVNQLQRGERGPEARKGQLQPAA